jgi:cell division protein FtsB
MKTQFSAGQWLREHSSGLLVVACSFLLLQDVFGAHGLMAMQRSRREAAHVRQEIKQLDDENRELETHIHALKSDPGTIECIAREQMGLARPGENVFKLPQTGKPDDNSDPCLESSTPVPVSQH